MNLKRIKEQREVRLDNHFETESLFNDLMTVVKMVNGTPDSEILDISLTTREKYLTLTLTYNIGYEE